MIVEDETPQERKARAELEAHVGELAQALRYAMPPDVGFALILTNYGARGSFAYAATVNREDMLKLFREAITKMGGGA